MPNLIDYPDYPSDPRTTKTHHELDCPVLGNIQDETMSWVEKNTNFLKDAQDTSFWHQIDGPDMARHCPSLLKYMKSVNIPIREVSVGVLTESMKQDGLVLHLGNAPLNIKVNFPIYNIEDVYTEWFDVPVEEMNRLGVMEYLPGVHIYNLWKIQDTVQDLYPCITRYNMKDKPIVFNSWIAHRVTPGPAAKYPRIMLATMPIIEPSHLLAK